MDAFMICGVCGGVIWTQIPDWDGSGNDNTANAVPMKGCICPLKQIPSGGDKPKGPKPKPTPQPKVMICPHCKGNIQVL